MLGAPFPWTLSSRMAQMAMFYKEATIFGLVSLQAEFPRLLELMELVDRKMSTRDKGAA